MEKSGARRRRHDSNDAGGQVNKFFGLYPVHIDSKGRMFFPRKLVAAIFAACGPVPQLVISKRIGEKCLMIQSAEKWSQQTEVLGQLGSSMSRDFARAMRLHAGMAQPVVMDQQYRILIDGMLREQANIGLDRDVLIIGCGEWIEIWDRETAEKEYKELESEEMKLAELLNSSHKSAQ